MFCFSLLPYYILQSIQAANSLWHPVCRSERDTEMFRQGQGKPEQLTLPLPPWSTQSSWSIFEYAHYFILVVFWIDDSSGWIGYSFPQGWCHRGISRINAFEKFCRFLSSMVPSTCSPISGRNLAWKGSRFGGHPWWDEESACEWPSTWCLYMSSFWSASPLVSHSRCQQHWPRFRETTNTWICPIFTSDIPSSCINI